MDSEQINVESQGNEAEAIICKACHKKNPTDFYFCPNCGKELKPKPLSTSIIKQLGIYLLSIFLPPLGLWPGIKYLKGVTANEKIVGAIAITLTLIVTIFSIWYTLELVKNFQSMLNDQLQSPVLRNSLNEQLKEQIENQYNFLK
ncbi:MAG: zinc ribbon domain-containing protein [Candidatus Levybacteria bacterium]|nr:zinc ribbon domain-containing protein [Candidatus Levybacteria bacterium]